MRRLNGLQQSDAYKLCFGRCLRIVTLPAWLGSRHSTVIFAQRKIANAILYDKLLSRRMIFALVLVCQLQKYPANCIATTTRGSRMTSFLEPLNVFARVRLVD